MNRPKVLTSEEQMEIVKESIRRLFSEEMLLCFWTHEHCPPGKEVVNCPINVLGKHKPCMPCWGEWVEKTFVDKIPNLTDSDGNKLLYVAHPDQTPIGQLQIAMAVSKGKSDRLEEIIIWYANLCSWLINNHPFRAEDYEEKLRR